MGKVYNALILSGIASIVLLLFDGTGVLSVIGRFFISPPTGWGTFVLDAMKSSLGVLTGAGVTAIIIGSTVIKMDWLLRLGWFTILISWIEQPLVQLWQFIGGKIAPLETCNNSLTCAVLVDGSTTTTLGMILAGLLIGPIIWYCFWACYNQVWSPESSG